MRRKTKKRKEEIEYTLATINEIENKINVILEIVKDMKVKMWSDKHEGGEIINAL